jgi:hypothetical protein
MRLSTNRTRDVSFASVVGLAGMVAILLVHVGRAFLSGPEFLLWVLGWMPNLAAAIALPFLLLAAYWIYIPAGKWKISTTRLFIVLVIATLLALVGWEIVQYLLWAYPMDAWDITATAVGCALDIAMCQLFLSQCAPESK